MRINLIRLTKQPFIVAKTYVSRDLKFTKNNLYYKLKIKMEISDSVTVFFTAIYCKGLKFC